MICKKIKQLLSEAQLKGLNFIEIEKLSEEDALDIQSCGFTIKYINHMFKISM